MKLPLPTKDELAASQHLQTIIATEIKQDGPIPFARYMQLALYHPGLGYYSGGARKFGAEGDFVTAPLVSPLFSYCMANQCSQIMAALDKAVVVELGAGTGVMALHLLQRLEELGALPQKYYILELSAQLKARQLALFKKKAPHYLTRIEWLSHLPRVPINGVIIANEVCDAMPVHRFQVENTVQEYYVDVQDHQLIWRIKEAGKKLVAAIDALELDFPIPYTSEINLLLQPWIASLAEILNRGAILLIDYGYPRSEYYHPERTMGTLMCHFRHHAHDDPLLYPGIQDITAFVDFTAIAEAAVSSSLTVSGFTHQAAFLMNCGLLEMLPKNSCDELHVELAQHIKRLTLPSEMGERFKAIALTKGFEQELLGFSNFNHIEKL